MELIKLSSNKKSFRTIIFKPGFNLIIGKMANTEKINPKMTYNGVGKSLIIRIVHFCLASNTVTEFAEKLSDWSFTLEFKVGSKHFSATRFTNNQRKITLNGNEMTLNDFRDLMMDEIFRPKTPVPNLVFRSLISRFIRPKTTSYTKYDVYVSKEQPYAQLVNNAFLLGVNVELILSKCMLKQDLKAIEVVEDGIKNEGITKELLLGGSDIKVELVDLREKISSLQIHLKEFKVAKDYNDIEKEANELSYKAKTINNEIVVLTEAIQNINNTILIKPDIKRQTIIDLYNEARIVFNDIVIKSIDEVEEFHTKLLSNRKKRLDSEKRKMETTLTSLNKELSSIDEERDKKLKYLDKHGALGEFVALSSQLNDLQFKYDKIENAEKVVNNCKQKKMEIQKNLIEQNIMTSEYLENSKELIEDNISVFRNFSKEFYEGKTAGIEIVNNEGNNTTRFDIKARIDDDASDGINSVKIFCFDMTLLTAKHNHKVNLLFHDSRLFSDMDPRQLSILFKIVTRIVAEKGIQYIATINQDALDTISQYFTPKEFKDKIMDNVILELTDESEKSKLLGIELNLQYE